MAESRRIIKVFLASPGDLMEERRRAKAIVDELNGLFADTFNCQVDLVGWEDTVSVFGRPQETINRDLERCELFVGLMWRKWGTPPDNSGNYSSGFEEEFRTSLERRRSGGRPEMSMLFKEISEEYLRDPGDQLRKVLSFRDELIERKEILFQVFASSDDFERRFRACVVQHLKKVARELEQISEESKQSPSSDIPNEESSAVQVSGAATPFFPEGAQFIRGLLQETTTSVDGAGLDDLSVARFRLLATLIGQPTNDSLVLGSHDANLMYVQRHRFTLSSGEIQSLFRAGLHYIAHENVPVWAWLSRLRPESHSSLVFASFSRDDIAVGAFQAMRLVELPLADVGLVSRDAIVSYWMRDEASREIKTAALSYLAKHGTPADLGAIRTEYDRNDSQTSGAAANAIISINLRQSRVAAFEAIMELRPSVVSDEVTSLLFADGAVGLGDSQLSMALGHPNASVRRLALQTAKARSLLNEVVLEPLLSDSDAEVRKTALEVLDELGSPRSLEEARKIIVKPRTGLLGVAPPFDMGAERAFDEYKLQRFLAIPLADLRAIAAIEGPFNREGYVALVARTFSTLASELRRHVDDGFSTAFDRDLERLATTFGATSKVVEDARPLKEFVRLKHTAAAVRLLCERQAPEDLVRIRKVLRDSQLVPAVQLSAYMAKWGEWDDIPLICSAVSREAQLRGLLMGPAVESQRAAARAIYQIGKSRLVEMIYLAETQELLPFIIAATANSIFGGLADAELLFLFRHSSFVVRKAAAAKAIASFPKRRIEALLDGYVQEPSRFYNVIFWLDAGISLDRVDTRKVSRNALRSFL